MSLCEFEILLGINFHVFARSIHVIHSDPEFYHVLKQVNEIRFFKYRCLAEMFPGVGLPTAGVVVLQGASTDGRKFRDTGILSVSLFRMDFAMHAGNAAVGDHHFFRVVGRMFRSMAISLLPTRIHGQGNVPVVGEQSLDQVRREEGIGLGADERFIHEVLCVHQRLHDVVVLPILVMPKGETGVMLFHYVYLVSADETDIPDTVLSECVQTAVEDSTPADLCKAFRLIGRRWHQSLATTGSYNNGSQWVMGLRVSAVTAVGDRRLSSTSGYS